APPEAPGVWGEVFDLLYRRHRRNRKRKERIARLLRAFSESTDAMPDGTVVLNQQWQILWFNEAASRLLGLTRHQDVGQHIANLVRNPAFTGYLSAQDFRDAVEIPSPEHGDVRVSLRVVPYGDGERLLLVRDVTRLHRLEQMRREFVANASHELRSPLTVIAGYLDVLGEMLAEDERLRLEWEKPIREMRSQAERMSATITDLLELSRLETTVSAGDEEQIHVQGMLTRIREEALALGEGPQAIRLEFLTDARLFGVEREIHSAFSNLVFNAMRYTPEGGSVVLRWFMRGEEACLSVIDTGIGIPEEHIPRITERFYRVDASRVRSSGGTGLGLAIVKHVLQRHGARLEIESTPGEGSEFTCVFPPQRAVAAAA
ncbi:MAG TPA: phosphate regulon sensor histidine kinase PhoR, partial [Woeseiaceae bacterium]|nr:phosphate regulon sensor histidine kinase PhoR [Woeseiaceae bacterium]